MASNAFASMILVSDTSLLLDVSQSTPIRVVDQLEVKEGEEGEPRGISVIAAAIEMVFDPQWSIMIEESISDAVRERIKGEVIEQLGETPEKVDKYFPI